MEMEYFNQPPKKFTFEMPLVKLWVEKWSKGKVLNLFDGKTKLNLDEYRVDIDKEMPADYYGDSYNFIKNTSMKFDTIILDPPYNLRKAREKYNGYSYQGAFTRIKDLLPGLLNPDGRIITFGYDSVGMSKSRGFTKIALCLICHNGDHNDTIGLCEIADLARVNDENIAKE
jgi:hypothetical protein